MDGMHFDRLTRALAAGTSRRRTIQSVAGGILAGLLAWPEIAAGKKKPKKPKKKPKKKSCPKGHRRCGKKCCKPIETCRQGRCVHHCDDGKLNQDETGPDCGGSCRNRKKCPRFQFCKVDDDCQSGVCLLLSPPDGLCVDCRIDSQCANNPDGPRCIRNLCTECAADFDCANSPGRPFCITTSACPPGIPCECSECRPGQNDCPTGEFCIAELGVCSENECVSGADCASGCCDDGRCADLSNDPGNCNVCGNQCPGTFPQCVMCCAGVCKNPPRGAPPGNECVCP